MIQFYPTLMFFKFMMIIKILKTENKKSIYKNDNLNIISVYQNINVFNEFATIPSMF